MFTLGWLVTLMDYISTRTFYVLTFHFLSYKLVSLGYIFVTGDNIYRLSEFPFLHDTETWMCNIYTIAGTGVSLLIWELFHPPLWKGSTYALNILRKMICRKMRHKKMSF